MCSVIIGFLMTLGTAVDASATLVDLGGGFIYDSGFNLTWYQDANYGLTSGYDNDGRMTWDEANAFLSNVNAGTIDNFGYTGWRLPSTVNQSCVGDPINPVSCLENELVHLYYSELGNSISAFTNSGPFLNLQPWEYWTSTVYSADDIMAWDFAFSNGTQYPNTKDHHFFTFLVHDGRVAAVPEPSTLLLVGIGLSGFVGLHRLRRRVGKPKWNR
jgi:hypothetical protein